MNINPNDTMDIMMELNTHPPIPQPDPPSPPQERPSITFPAPNVAHTHTIILLHAKAQDGPDFLHELLVSSKTSNDRTLPDEFPSVKWVFPSAVCPVQMPPGYPWSPEWYCMHDVQRPWDKGEWQFYGLTRGEEFLRRIIDEEALLLRDVGGYERVLIGGISQGSAMALSVFLASGRRYKLGGFMGLCGWMPLLNCEADRPSGWMDGFRKCVHERILKAPVLLEHSLGDNVVPYENFRRMRDVLVEVGFEVEANEHEYQGHWIAEEKAVEDITEWLFYEVGVQTDRFREEDEDGRSPGTGD